MIDSDDAQGKKTETYDTQKYRPERAQLVPVCEIEIIKEKAEKKSERAQPQKSFVILVPVIIEKTESGADDDWEDRPMDGHTANDGKIFEGEKNSDKNQNNSDKKQTSLILHGNGAYPYARVRVSSINTPSMGNIDKNVFRGKECVQEMLGKTPIEY